MFIFCFICDCNIPFHYVLLLGLNLHAEWHNEIHLFIKTQNIATTTS